ncbi:unnamed protein product [Urochloa humidicola]
MRQCAERDGPGELRSDEWKKKMRFPLDREPAVDMHESLRQIVFFWRVVDHKHGGRLRGILATCPQQEDIHSILKDCSKKIHRVLKDCSHVPSSYKLRRISVAMAVCFEVNNQAYV